MGWRDRFLAGNDKQAKKDGPTEGPEETQESQEARAHTAYMMDGRRRVAPRTCYCTEYSGDHEL